MPMRAPTTNHDRDCSRDRQLAGTEEPDDEHAAEAGDVADAQIEVACDQRYGQTSGDDRADRHIVDDVPEVADRRERAWLQDGEDQQHRDEDDDRAVGAE